MGLLPTALGTRPRLAIEIRPEGVVAARSEDAEALLSGISFVQLNLGAVAPGLKAGNLPERVAVVAAIRKALEAVMLKERETTLVLPDATVRVLLLEFDELPVKPAEALPVVRFRLRKLLPFDADDAAVSYQVMSSTKGLVRVVAVAIPREVLAEYEGVVRDAGFEPGAVLPSTLAALSSLDGEGEATLMVNADESSVTTAIVQENVLLLHRMVNFTAEGLELTPDLEVPVSREIPPELLALPLVDVDGTAAEWTMQQPLNGYGVINDDPIALLADEHAREQDKLRLAAERHAATVVRERRKASTREVTQAMSVAAAYFEDTQQRRPGVLLCSGSLPAKELRLLLSDAGLDEDEMSVREIVEPAMLGDGLSAIRVPQGWLAGVRGALRS